MEGEDEGRVLASNVTHRDTQLRRTPPCFAFSVLAKLITAVATSIGRWREAFGQSGISPDQYLLTKLKFKLKA